MSAAMLSRRKGGRASLWWCVALAASLGCAEDSDKRDSDTRNSDTRNSDTRDSDAARADTSPPVVVVDTSALAPAGVRIRVQVLNATKTTGLARRATQRLRDLGYDVVDWNSRSEPATATLITVRPPARAWGERLQRALGTGTVSESATLSPYIDALVVLGPDWTPPAEPFRP
jgi:hypothetical protein